MRIARSTLIGTAVAMALFGPSTALHAQTVVQPPSDGALPAQAAADQAPKQADLQEVVVSGIRYSTEKALATKRAATTVEEVITAEDIGKMPDKNVADALSHVPGVTVSSAGANEGGFDENDRVSMRGTGPSMTQTLIDGHNVASGDWFVLDQTGTVGRSVSYTLLPSELVSEVLVKKSSEASLVEGGVAGSVDIITRKPLESFNKPFTLEVSAGAVYADLPSKTDPQFSALANFKNDDGTFGVLAQGFYEDRHLRRDGTEILGYDQIAPGTTVAKADPNLANVWYPHYIGSALFEQERKRTGGLINVEFKASDAVKFDLSGFYANMDAPNYNRNYLLRATNFVNFGNGQAPNPGYVVTGNTLTSATFAPIAGTDYGIYDQISRPDESADSAFVNLDGTFIVTDHFHLDGQIGWSQGHGKTPTQNVAETEPGVGSGAAYSLNGTSRPPDWSLTGVNYTQPFPPGDPSALTFGWIFGGQFIDTIDKETWAKLDGTVEMDSDAWQDLKFGARYQKHDRSSVGSVAQGPTAAGQSPSQYPTTYSNYPSDYTTFGSNIPTGIWYWTPAQLAAYNSPTNVNRDPVTRAYPPYWFGLSEPDTAVYVQADFKGDQWAANVGVRYVHTVEDTITYAPLNCSTPLVPNSNPPCPANLPGLLATSAFGPFQAVPVDESYNDILPSANFKWQFAPDLIGRLAASETMTRADYSALSGTTSLTPPGAVTPGPGTNCLAVPPVNCGSGTASNPFLKPIRSTDLDAGLEWYFAPRSLLAGSLYYMDLRNYIGYGTEYQSYNTFGPGIPNGQLIQYNLTVPINTTGRVTGFEIAYQQAFGDHFGLEVNYNYNDAKQTSDVPTTGASANDDRLVGASKNVYSIGGYYEDSHFSARVTYNYRSSFYAGLDRSTAFTQDDTGTLAASLAYLINQNFSINLDGLNLNNPTLKYYAQDSTQPRAFYTNGRQYYLTFRAKF